MSKVVGGKLVKKNRNIMVARLGRTDESVPMHTSTELHRGCRRRSPKTGRMVNIKPAIPFRKLKAGVTLFNIHAFPIPVGNTPLLMGGKKWLEILKLNSRPVHFVDISMRFFIEHVHTSKFLGQTETRNRTRSLLDLGIIRQGYIYHRTFLTQKNADKYHDRIYNVSRLSTRLQRDIAVKYQHDLDHREVDRMFGRY